MTDMNAKLFGLFIQNLINEHGDNVSHVSISHGYWEWKHPEKKNMGRSVTKTYITYLESDSDPLPFLLNLCEKYSDAPDILDYIARTYFQNDESISAIKYYIKLVELYPFVKEYRKEIEVCQTFIAYDNMPETDESAEWLRIKIKEIDEKYWEKGGK